MALFVRSPRFLSNGALGETIIVSEVLECGEHALQGRESVLRHEFVAPKLDFVALCEVSRMVSSTPAIMAAPKIHAFLSQRRESSTPDLGSLVNPRRKEIRIDFVSIDTDTIYCMQCGPRRLGPNSLK